MITDGPVMESTQTLLIANDIVPSAALATALGAEQLSLPRVTGVDCADWRWAPALESWRREQCSSVRRFRYIVVAPWLGAPVSSPLLQTDLEAWSARCEAALAGWFTAMGCAQELCADGGSIVAVAETPASLDSAEWAPEVAVADAVVALVRSLARSEGERGVRVNAVTTPWRMTTAECVAPAPALAGFPGRLEEEVAGAVRLLLSPDSQGLTGSVLRADCGRSWT